MKQPFAYIHPAAKIHPSVVIEPFVTIDQNVEIGEGTHIGSNVTIMEGARIGKNCNIFPGAVISGIPQDLKFKGEDTVAIIGNNVIISNATQIAGEVQVDDFAVIGGGTLIHQFCHLGAHVMIQGGSRINKDIPPYVKAGRDPIAYTRNLPISLSFASECVRCC